MPTTFNVISIGNLADIDTTEGNNTAENASALVGMTFGGAGDALVNDFVEMSSVGSVNSRYDTDNSPNDQFSIEGGAAQTFDSTAIYNATVTYIDGTTDTVTMVLFQDVSGNTYLAPEFSPNADQTVLEAGAIRSISLDSLFGNTYNGMTTSRQTWDFVTCFTRDTRIETATGPVPVQHLSVGDLIKTADRGLQPVRWIGSKTVSAKGALAPILIRNGALGNTEDLCVSPQHRMFLNNWRAELYSGEAEVLAAAKHLVNDDSIRVRHGDKVEYFHLMFDQHELIYAAGILSESFHPGKVAWGSLERQAQAEILSLFPELRANGLIDYGVTVRPAIKPHEASLFAA